MSKTTDIDVIVGGGGVAGVATAAAMRQLGYQVMVVEPGQRDERRLAGEVFHPPGVSGLADLGLLPTLNTKPAVSVKGFSVTYKDDYIQLPYDSVPHHRAHGLCLEHGLIRERLLSTISEFPNVRVKRGTRVVAVDHSNPSHVVVEVANGSNSGSYRCSMFVIADGSPSRLARLAGITVYNRLISTVWAYRIGTENMPQRDFGHVFLGAATPILLYPISRDEARILFDIPYQSHSHPTAADCLAFAQTLPRMLREEITRTIGTQQRMSVVTRATITDQIVRDRVVLVGDAGGSCHPLTATGMTMCVSDALLLREALAERPANLPAALRLYQRRRRWPQATRLVLADALRDTFCGTRPELRVVQCGIVALWRDNPVARAATVALLSTADGRPLALTRQIIAVMVRGFIAHLRNPTAENRALSSLVIARSLVATLFRNIRQLIGKARRADSVLAPKHALRGNCDQPRWPRTIARKASHASQP